MFTYRSDKDILHHTSFSYLVVNYFSTSDFIDFIDLEDFLFVSPFSPCIVKFSGFFWHDWTVYLMVENVVLRCRMK